MSDARALLFGQIAVEWGLIAPETLRESLDAFARERTNRRDLRLGQFLCDRGYLTPAQRDEILLAQDLSEARETDRLFGEIAILNGLATAVDVRDALAEQNAAVREGREVPRIGEVLIARGRISPQDVDAVLAAQRRLFQGGAAGEKPAAKPPTRSGLRTPRKRVPLGVPIDALRGAEAAAPPGGETLLARWAQAWDDLAGASERLDACFHATQGLDDARRDGVLSAVRDIASGLTPETRATFRAFVRARYGEALARRIFGYGKTPDKNTRRKNPDDGNPPAAAFPS